MLSQTVFIGRIRFQAAFAKAIRQPENEQPENHLATDLSLSANTASTTPQQPENHLAVPRQTARQPETIFAKES